MESPVSDEQLWSWVDRSAPELAAHLAAHPEDGPRVAELRACIAAADARMPPQIGSCRPTRRLGEGGMGVVFEAEQVMPRRRVAVKVLREAMLGDARAEARFRRESDALARLVHPSIASVYEAGVTDTGLPYLILELVDGEPLSAHISAGDLPFRRRLEVFLEIVRAVEFAHSQGVLHRDLKPSNVLLTRDGKAKIVDFGLAQIATGEVAASPPLTESGRLLGTLEYMSPEQARGNTAAVDTRSDVYALGVILYELLEGVRPLDVGTHSLPDAVRLVCEAEPKRLRVRGAMRLRDLQAIVDRAIAKEKDHRYATAKALADDVERYLDGRPVEVRRVGWFARTAARIRRRPARFMMITAAAALALWAAAMTAYRVGALGRISPNWYATASPFERIAWVGDQPIVDVGGKRYELASINGLDAAYVVGFCKQTAEHSWRKRISEDLLQVLNRLGSWSVFRADLGLRELDGGRIVTLSGVTMAPRLRQEIWRERVAWRGPGWRVVGGKAFQGDVDATRRLIRYGPLEGEALHRRIEAIRYVGTYDPYDFACEVLGRSPDATLSADVVDADTGVRHSIDPALRFVELRRR